jgi:thioredoxin-related protein
MDLNYVLILLSITVFILAISVFISMYKEGIITTRNYKILEKELDYKQLVIDQRDKEITMLSKVIKNNDKIQTYLIDHTGIQPLTHEQYNRIFEKKEKEDEDADTLQ